MPSYTCNVPAGRLTPEQKAKAASEITRVHNEVTGAATFFAQVIFNEVAPGNYFSGGKPLRGEQFFLNGQIRGGRSAIDRSRLLLGLRDVLAAAAETDRNNVRVYLTDLPPRDMVEYGQVLPEPGQESVWLAALPEADRERMLSASRS